MGGNSSRAARSAAAGKATTPKKGKKQRKDATTGNGTASPMPASSWLVLDIGAFECRAGFATDTSVRCVAPMLVAWQEGVTDKAFYGKEAKEKVGVSGWSVSRIISVQSIDWPHLELLLRHVVHDRVGASSGEYCVAFLAPRTSDVSTVQSAKRLSALFLDSLGAQAVMPVDRGALPVYAAPTRRSTTAILVDFGLYQTSVMPVFEGYALPAKMQHSRSICGSAVSRKLRDEAGGLDQGSDGSTWIQMDRFKQDHLSVGAAAAPGLQDTSKVTATHSMTFTLGQVRSAAEVYCGVVELIAAVLKNVDQELRPELMQRVVLTGGAARIPGLAERMREDLLTMLTTAPFLKVDKKMEKKLRKTARVDVAPAAADWLGLCHRLTAGQLLQARENFFTLFQHRSLRADTGVDKFVDAHLWTQPEAQPDAAPET